MNVICHGLSLPLSEHETIKDCVNVYCEWLTALYHVPRISVPRPICEDPNVFARKIIMHFHNLFVPRHGEGKNNDLRNAFNTIRAFIFIDDDAFQPNQNKQFSIK